MEFIDPAEDGPLGLRNLAGLLFVLLHQAQELLQEAQRRSLIVERIQTFLGGREVVFQGAGHVAPLFVRAGQLPGKQDGMFAPAEQVVHLEDG